MPIIKPQALQVNRDFRCLVGAVIHDWAMRIELMKYNIGETLFMTIVVAEREAEAWRELGWNKLGSRLFCAAT